MSKEGINLAAGVFSQMQEIRRQLLGGDTQDIALGQMIERGKDHMKNDFCKITMETPKSTAGSRQ